MEKSLRDQFEEFCIQYHLYYNFDRFGVGYKEYNTNSAFITFKYSKNYFSEKVA